MTMYSDKIGSMLFTQQIATAETTFEALRQQAKDAGLRKLGNGVFGVVFDHPTDNRLVIKIGREGRRSARSSKAVKRGPWLDWTLCSQQSLTAAFRPVILKLDTYYSEQEELSYIAVMEKLSPMESDRYDESKELVKLIDSSAQTLNDLRINIRTSKARYTCDDARKTSGLVKSLWKYHGDDLHGGNMMVRVVGGKRRPIITDPVA